MFEKSFDPKLPAFCKKLIEEIVEGPHNPQHSQYEAKAKVDYNSAILT